MKNLLVLPIFSLLGFFHVDAPLSLTQTDTNLNQTVIYYDAVQNSPMPSYVRNITPKSLGLFRFRLLESDCEGGKTVYNEGTITIEHDGRAVYAKLNILSVEPDDNWSRGIVDDRVAIYYAPKGKKINRILGDKAWKFGRYRDLSYNIEEKPQMSPSTCPWDVYVNARRDKMDYCGEGYVRVESGTGQISIELF